MLFREPFVLDSSLPKSNCMYCIFVPIEDTKDACDCGPGMGACHDGTCHPASKRCDGVNDCPGSHEDEQGCRKTLCWDILNICEMYYATSISML